MAKNIKVRAPQTKTVDTLSKLLALRFRALTFVEKESAKALKLLSKKVSSAELKTALTKVMTDQKGHIEELEQLSKTYGVKAPPIRIAAILGMAQDGKNIVTLVKKGPALDTSIILEQLYQLHYSMAGYEMAKAWAEELAESNIAKSLEEIIMAMKTTDEDMMELAEKFIHPNVKPTDSEEEESR